MTDYVNLGLVVVFGYVAIVYGPGIVANIQAGQPPLTGVVPPAQAQTQTPLNALDNLLGAPPAPADTAGPSPDLGFAIAPSAPSRFAGVDLLSPLSRTACPDPNKCQSVSVNGVCLCKGTADCPANGCTTLNTPPTTQSNTRQSKKPVPPHAAAKAKTCHGLKCGPGTGVTCGGLGCPQLDANVGYFDSYSIPVEGPQWYRTVGAREYQANMTQVIQGKTVTTIDPYFPGGFFLVEAGRKASRHEPALH